jgi:hypothetical protein
MTQYIDTELSSQVHGEGSYNTQLINLIATILLLYYQLSSGKMSVVIFSKGYFPFLYLFT